MQNRKKKLTKKNQADELLNDLLELDITLLQMTHQGFISSKQYNQRIRKVKLVREKLMEAAKYSLEKARQAHYLKTTPTPTLSNLTHDELQVQKSYFRRKINYTKQKQKEVDMVINKTNQLLGKKGFLNELWMTFYLSFLHRRIRGIKKSIEKGGQEFENIYKYGKRLLKPLGKSIKLDKITRKNIVQCFSNYFHFIDETKNQIAKLSQNHKQQEQSVWIQNRWLKLYKQRAYYKEK